jgi:hypothetical protein
MRQGGFPLKIKAYPILIVFSSVGANGGSPAEVFKFPVEQNTAFAGI